MKLLIFLPVLAHSLVSILSAAPAAPTDRIREGELQQQQIRGDAQRLVEQLTAMLGEYERNGLAGDEVTTVAAVRDSIERLTAGEMKVVIELLEKARGVGDDGAAKKTVSEAYASQKQILTQMQRLLAQHRRNREALELSQALTQLADRQSTNLQNGITLGQWTGGKKPESFEAAMQANLEGQKSEQAAIAAELKMMAEKIAQFAKAPENAEMAARFNKGLEAAQKVQPHADAAAEALKNGQLFKAVTDEKVARDAMRRLAKEIAPPQDRAEALRSAERELAKMLAEQKEIVANTQKAVPEADFEKWLDNKTAADKALQKQSREQLRQSKELQRQFKEQRTAKANDLQALEAPQGDLAAKSDLLAQDLQKDAPAAAPAMKAAQEKMQEARGAMTDKDGEAALKGAKEALAQMEAAHAQVAREAAKAEALAGKSGDAVKDLQALQKQTEQLAQQQAAAAKDPDKTGQAALAQQAAELAQRADQMAPQAAAAMQQAAANAQQAAQAAQAGQPAQAAPAQQAAAQNLQQAAQAMAQQAAAAGQAQAQLAAAQQAAAALAEIIIAEQKLQMETAKALAQAKPKEDWRFKGQPEKQAEIRTQTDTFKATLTPDLAAAIPAVGNASTAMGEAKTHLDNPGGELAKAAELRAIDALYQAQKALGETMAQAQEAMQQEPAAPNANAQQQAQAQLDQAALALAQAQESLKDAQAAQAAQAQAQQAGQPNAAKAAAKMAAKELDQAAAQAAQAAAKAGEAAAKGAAMNAAAQAPAQQAAQAAAEAAAQAAGNDAPAAQAAATQAQAALAQAQAAMAQALAGVTPASGPPMPGEGQAPGPPGPPGPPGSKPGTKPGSKPGKPGQMPGPPGTEGAEKYTPSAEEAVQMATRAERAKKANFAGLPPRERAAIEQSLAEKYPEEYGALVEQYLLNLATESTGKK